MNAEELAELLANEFSEQGRKHNPNPKSFRWMEWEDYSDWRKKALIATAQIVLGRLDMPQPLMVEVNHDRT